MLKSTTYAIKHVSNYQPKGYRRCITITAHNRNPNMESTNNVQKYIMQKLQVTFVTRKIVQKNFVKIYVAICSRWRVWDIIQKKI